jgi:hypothetical protein
MLKVFKLSTKETSLMPNCTQNELGFPSFDRRKIEANFAGGDVSSIITLMCYPHPDAPPSPPPLRDLCDLLFKSPVPKPYQPYREQCGFQYMRVKRRWQRSPFGDASRPIRTRPALDDTISFPPA